MKFVATKTADQLDLQALHRVRAPGQPPRSRRSRISYSLESDISGTTRQLKDLGAAGGSKDIPTVPSIGTTARTLQLSEADTTATTNQTTGIPPELAPVDQT